MPAKPQMDDEHDCFICHVVCDCGTPDDDCVGCSTCAEVDDNESEYDEEYDDDNKFN